MECSDSVRVPEPPLVASTGPESAFELGSWILLNSVNSEGCVLASYYRALKPQPCPDVCLGKLTTS